MNESEILSELKSALEWVSDDDNPNGSIAIKISSIREMIKILEKREPKPIMITTNEYGAKLYHCPSCKRPFWGLFLMYKDYCYNCGQALNWEGDWK